MSEIPGFSFEQWDQLLRMNETDPQEAARRFLAGISLPKRWEKSRYPIREFDRREYNLIVTLQDNGDNVATRLLLLNLARNNGRFENFNASANDAPEFRINVVVKIVNRSIFPLNPQAANDRSIGEYPDIDPGNTYQGPVFLPYLLVWMAGGLCTLQGV